MESDRLMHVDFFPQEFSSDKAMRNVDDSLPSVLAHSQGKDSLMYGTSTKYTLLLISI